MLEKNGDVPVRNDVIQAHYLAHAENLIRLITFKRQGNQHDAEDIVHEAYSKALRHFNTYDSTTWKFATWFGRILINCEKDFAKDCRTHGMNDEFDEENYEPVIEDHVRVQDVIGIHRLIDKQQKDTRNVLLLYYVYQYSLSEIDSVLPAYGYKKVDNIVKDFRLKAMREKKL
jgi:RNA polymerase sigma factor (sigma-70 family)